MHLPLLSNGHLGTEANSIQEESDIFNAGLFNFSTYNLGLIILIYRQFEVFFVKFIGDFDVCG